MTAMLEKTTDEQIEEGIEAEERTERVLRIAMWMSIAMGVACWWETGNILGLAPSVLPTIITWIIRFKLAPR